MDKYIKYLNYVMRHKWYVFVECCKMGIPIRGVLHDLSKLLPDEFIPYANHFYGKRKKENIKAGNYNKVTDTRVDLAFDKAWLKHIHRNPHHPQHWILQEDSGTKKVLEMPDKYKKELLCDWSGAGRAQGKPKSKNWEETRNWYNEHKNSIVLGKGTRKWIEKKLQVA